MLEKLNVFFLLVVSIFIDFSGNILRFFVSYEVGQELWKTYITIWMFLSLWILISKMQTKKEVFIFSLGVSIIGSILFELAIYTLLAEHSPRNDLGPNSDGYIAYVLSRMLTSFLSFFLAGYLTLKIKQEAISKVRH